MSEADITIIGGGVVGLTLASLLADTDYQVTLIDYGPPPPSGLKTPYDLRVAAINHASERIFRYTGAWDIMTKLRTNPYQKMFVWDECTPAKIDFDCTETGQNHLGHIIEYSVIRQALHQYLMKQKNIHLAYETKPIAIQTLQDTTVLTLEGGELHHTKLCVGADGGNSWVAKETGLARKARPYEQSALVTSLKTEKSHKHTAWQRFLTTGPLALLPLSDPHMVSIVWSTLPGHANHLATLSEKAFNQTLADAFEHKLGKVKILDERIVFPLTERRATEYVQSRIALIGDAAHTIHPLAGQGMNLGLLDAASLAQVLKACHAEKGDPGEYRILRRYERWRKGENELMIKAMGGFKHIFGQTSALYTHARSLGFTAADNIPFIKNIFMERAMGLSGELPEIAQELGVEKT